MSKRYTKNKSKINKLEQQDAPDIFDLREEWCIRNCNKCMFDKETDKYVCSKNYYKLCAGIIICPLNKKGRPIN